MENKKYFLYLLYVLIFSSSIVWSAHIVSNSTQKDTEKEEYDDLLTQSELLEYLHISEDELNEIINEDDGLKVQLSSYDTYRFLPYLEIGDKRMYLMNEINEWLKYKNDHGVYQQ
ncbi:Clp protease ClpB [Cytobacillus sp. Hm23]